MRHNGKQHYVTIAQELFMFCCLIGSQLDRLTQYLRAVTDGVARDEDISGLLKIHTAVICGDSRFAFSRPFLSRTRPVFNGDRG